MPGITVGSARGHAFSNVSGQPDTHRVKTPSARTHARHHRARAQSLPHHRHQPGSREHDKRPPAELHMAAIDRRDKWEMHTFSHRVCEVAEGDPKRMLDALFTVLHEWFNDKDYSGCIFLSACSEFPSAHDPIHKAAAGHYASVQAAIIDIAQSAGARDPETLARQLIMLLQGALTVRQVGHDDTTAKRAATIARTLIAEQLQEN